MGLVRIGDSRPPFWLPGGHLQTIYPALFRKVGGVIYQRETIATPDGDFLLLDWSRAQPARRAETVIILSHGFEGDSYRPYIKGMVKTLLSLGHDCLAWNFRSCGGVLNSTPGFYHSGATDDLDLVVRYALRSGYKEVGLVGFSLGGNLTLKYLGEQRDRPEGIGKALCFSVPMDLEACSKHLNNPINRGYQNRFLNTLRLKIRQKATAFPDHVDARLLADINSVYAFDDLITAPLHGFQNAAHYYTSCSARHFLADIRVPTRILHAANDPMIPLGCLPLGAISRLEHVSMLLTANGGHCGFQEITSGEMSYRSEREAKAFFAT